MSHKLLNKDLYGYRFLVSFSGKYLAYNYSPPSSHSRIEGDTASNLDHQLCKIQVPQTDADCFGPAFIEVNILVSSLTFFTPCSTISWDIQSIYMVVGHM